MRYDTSAYGAQMAKCFFYFYLKSRAQHPWSNSFNYIARHSTSSPHPFQTTSQGRGRIYSKLPVSLGRRYAKWFEPTQESPSGGPFIPQIPFVPSRVFPSRTDSTPLPRPTRKHGRHGRYCRNQLVRSLGQPFPFVLQLMSVVMSASDAFAETRFQDQARESPTQKAV